MANNRLYFVCDRCRGEADAASVLAKYYPGTGWYLWDAEKSDAWLSDHQHGGDGEYIRVVQERDLDA